MLIAYLYNRAPSHLVHVRKSLYQQRKPHHILYHSKNAQRQHVCSEQRHSCVRHPFMILAQVTYVKDRMVPIHEKALLDHLTNYQAQLVSINGRLSTAVSDHGNTIIRSESLLDEFRHWQNFPSCQNLGGTRVVWVQGRTNLRSLVFTIIKTHTNICPCVISERSPQLSATSI